MNEQHMREIRIGPNCYCLDNAKAVAEHLVTKLTSTNPIDEITQLRAYAHCCETIIGEEISVESLVFAWISINLLIDPDYEHDFGEEGDN